MRLATEEGIDPFKATLLIGIMSVGSTLGRLLFGKMADHPKVNRLYLYQISFLMIGISNTLCPVLTSYSGLVIYATVFGFFEGCYVLLAPVLTGDIVGRDKMAHGVGVLFALKSVPLTLGPPIAGELKRVKQGLISILSLKSIINALGGHKIKWSIPTNKNYNKTCNWC